jgi:hypothetical protein
MPDAYVFASATANPLRGCSTHCVIDARPSRDLTPCRAARAKLVGYGPLRQTSLLLQQGCLPRLAALVLRGLDNLVENVAVLIDGTPEPVFLPPTVTACVPLQTSK